MMLEQHPRHPLLAKERRKVQRSEAIARTHVGQPGIALHHLLHRHTVSLLHLSAVAPGVAEALVATAAALAVAIPATFAYNIFANRLNSFDNTMESFGTAVIAMLVREGRI